MDLRPPRIALDVSAAVDPRPTGVARYVRGIVDGLSERSDLEVTLLCRSSRWRRADPAALLGTDAVRRWFDLRALRGFDLIHAPDLRVPRRPGPSLVVTIHDLSALDRSDHASTRFLAKKRARIDRALREASAIITHASSVRSDLLARTGLPPERVTAVPLWPGLPSPDRTPPPPADDPSRVGLLLVGGPSVRKGSERIVPFLRAWDAANGHSDEPVLWCGSATDEEVARFLASLPTAVAERITWLGHITDAELDARLRGARAFVQLSDTEGFGIPLLEAAARHCPVLAWRCPTAEEVLPGGSAFRLGGADEESELAAAARPVERRTRADRAAAIAGEFSHARTVERTVEVYTSTLERVRSADV